MRVVPDTNVWITWSARAPEDLSLGDRGDALPFLATITLQELWAGARSTADRAYCERLLVEAQRHGKLLNPPAAAWILAGQALGVLARRGRLGAARLRAVRNDVLVAPPPRGYDAAGVTPNRAHFTPNTSTLPVRVVGAA